MQSPTLPRIVVAGLGGGAGKTVISLALLFAARRLHRAVRAFKKGPDYIDAAWLTWASGNPARNLDTYLMGFHTAVASFASNAVSDGLNVVEGNRGVFDGMDVAGTHSSAALAKALNAPVLLVLNVAKVTRTVAAYILGAQKLDPDLNLAGVVLNYVNGRRHEQIVRDSIASVCDIPVVGVVPKLDPAGLVPERHLGLVTPEDCSGREALEPTLLEEVIPGLDMDAVFRIASAAPSLTVPHICPVSAGGPPLSLPFLERQGGDVPGSRLKIAYFKDSAFSFYYAENLEALERSGAELVAISPLTAASLPADISALYIGGGFPEVHAAALAANACFLRSLHQAAHNGLPIYAECGGLMVLSRAIVWQGSRYPMAGVFPFEAHVCSTAQGHGYAELLVDRANPFFPAGLSLRGHEFHYSKIELENGGVETACQVRRGKGIGQGRDAVIFKNIWAGYTHLHALATPEWTAGLLRAARQFASQSQAPVAGSR
jgi:cobyrinic acid a,c-diamide synthase